MSADIAVSFNNEELGKIAYNAYVQGIGGVSLRSGDSLPSFEQLPGLIKNAWSLAGIEVARWVATKCTEHLDAAVAAQDGAKS